MPRRIEGPPAATTQPLTSADMSPATTPAEVQPEPEIESASEAPLEGETPEQSPEIEVDFSSHAYKEFYLEEQEHVHVYRHLRTSQRRPNNIELFYCEGCLAPARRPSSDYEGEANP